MSVPTCTTPAAALTAPAIPTRARTLAAELATLFEADQQIVLRLNDAHRRLAAANDRLWTGPVLDPFTIHEQIRRAFSVYQQASEDRRQLAVDVGELTQQLADALATAGHPAEHARSANIHELAAGTWQPPTPKERKR